MEINATLIIQAINFLLAYVLLRLLFFKPVVRAIKEEDSQRNSLLTGIEKRTQLLREKEEEKKAQWAQCQNYFAQHAPTLRARFVTAGQEIIEPKLTPLDAQAVAQQTVVLQGVIIQKVGASTINKKDARV